MSSHIMTPILKSCLPCLQVTTVGIPSQIFRPGVMVPEVLHKGVAERSGLRSGDLITYVAGNRLVASPYAVNEFVNVIKWVSNLLH